jgi:hypothetical protein
MHPILTIHIHYISTHKHHHTLHTHPTPNTCSPLYTPLHPSTPPLFTYPKPITPTYSPSCNHLSNMYTPPTPPPPHPPRNTHTILLRYPYSQPSLNLLTTYALHSPTLNSLLHYTHLTTHHIIILPLHTTLAQITITLQPLACDDATAELSDHLSKARIPL